MDGRVDAHSLNTADHLCDLSLVDGAEAGVFGVLDHGGGGGEVLDEGEVLFHCVSIGCGFSSMCSI